MIYSITGTLIEIEPTFAVVQTGGVGYRCATSTTTLASLPKLGAEVSLFTYLYVREDTLDLYGFATQEELRCFRLLISVSGVGPKVAIAILSAQSPQRLIMAIAAGDTKAVRGPGVGPKISQRIILELRDKVGADDLTKSLSGFDAGTGGALQGELSAQGEAIAALAALGYGQTDAAAAVSRLDRSLATDELIKGALKLLSKGV